MKKRTIQHIDVLQAGKVHGVIMALVGLIIVLPFMLIFGAVSSIFGKAGGIGVFSMLFAPILYGIIGFIIGAISAALYNVTYKFHGGVSFTFKDDEVEEISQIGNL